MAYYFSYDAVISDYVEKEGFYKKEDLHCTLAYSTKNLLDNQLEKLNFLDIPHQQNMIVKGVDVFNDYIVLLIDNPNLTQINKELLKEFSIIEDHADRKMHVSIKKGIANNLINLHALEQEYIGREVLLKNPKLYIKTTNGLNSKETTVIYLADVKKRHNL